MSKYKKSVLLIDDNKPFVDNLARQLRKEVERVQHVDSVEDAVALLKGGTTFTFVFADRNLHGEEIERRNLGLLKKAAGAAHLIVYTSVDELTPSRQYYLHAAGAIRVLDKKEVDKFAEDVSSLTREFDDLLELREEIKTATKERSRLVAALVGTHIGVSIIDTDFHCWFANSQQEKIVGNPCAGFACWTCFHNHPIISGPCFGCTVAEVTSTKKAAERPFLTKMPDGSVRWFSVRSLPIFSRDDPSRVIAVREGVSEDTEILIGSMTQKERLQKIAHGLLHAGFGRVRIYKANKIKQMLSLICAAAQTDDVTQSESSYMKWLPHDLDPNHCVYATEALKSRTGIFVENWKKHGSSVFVDTLKFKPPYFYVPIWGSDDKLCAFLAVEFGGLDTARYEGEPEDDVKLRYQAALDHLAKPESLVWLHEGYGREIRKAIENNPIVLRERSRYQEVNRAKINTGLMRSVKEAKKNLLTAFQNVVPDCTVSVRLLDTSRGELTEREDFLLSSPDPPVAPPVILISDPNSFAAYVVRVFQRPLWIDDYEKYLAQAKVEGKPSGYCKPGTKSAAVIPLQFESAVYGALSIDSYKTIRWEEGGYLGPLELLAYLTTLVLRDDILYEGIADKAAMALTATVFSAGVVWKEATIEGLHEMVFSLDDAEDLCKQIRAPKTRQAIEQHLKRMREIASHIIKGPSVEQPEPDNCVLSTVLNDLRRQYADDRVAFKETADNIKVALPYSEMHRIVNSLVGGALKALQKSGEVAGITVAVERPYAGRVPIAVTVPSLTISPALIDDSQDVDLLLAHGTALRYKGELTISSSDQFTRLVVRVPQPIAST